MEIFFNGIVASFKAPGGVPVTVSLLPGCLVLIGHKVHQFFSIQDSVKDWGDLPKALPDRDSLLSAAGHYTEGHTNKDKFLHSVEKLLRARKIGSHDYAKLREFIAKCDCAPSRIRRKLVSIGYSHLPLDFEDVDPRLEWSLETAQLFIAQLHKQ